MQDELLGWLRDAGELSHAELVAQFDQPTYQRLIDVVQCFLSGCSFRVTLRPMSSRHGCMTSGEVIASGIGRWVRRCWMQKA